MEDCDARASSRGGVSRGLLVADGAGRCPQAQVAQASIESLMLGATSTYKPRGGCMCVDQVNWPNWPFKAFSMAYGVSFPRRTEDCNPPLCCLFRCDVQTYKEKVLQDMCKYNVEIPLCRSSLTPSTKTLNSCQLPPQHLYPSITSSPPLTACNLIPSSG